MTNNLKSGREAFLDYPSKYEQHPFDTVKMDFFPGRKRNPAVVDVYCRGSLVARCYPCFAAEHWREQLSREIGFIEQNKHGSVVYFVNVHGEDPYTVSSLDFFEIN